MFGEKTVPSMSACLRENRPLPLKSSIVVICHGAIAFPDFKKIKAENLFVTTSFDALVKFGWHLRKGNGIQEMG